MQTNIQKIENKLKQLELGLDVHRVEVSEIRKQINTIQLEKKDSNDKDYQGDGDPENVIFAKKDDIEGYARDQKEMKCNFQTEIDPKPDIQVRS